MTAAPAGTWMPEPTRAMRPFSMTMIAFSRVPSGPTVWTLAPVIAIGPKYHGHLTLPKLKTTIDAHRQTGEEGEN